MKLNVAYLGLIDYAEALKIQEKLLDLRYQNKVEDTLLILEHPPVLTLGRRGVSSNIIASQETLKAEGVSIYEVNRGGDVTYHGPGQIVGYPIMDLNGYGKDVKDFVGKVEEVFIRVLDVEYGIQAWRDEKKYTGVWVENEKITAIGIAVKHWITMHGFAFNVNTQLSHFNWIVPCGITDKGVTSLKKLVGYELDFKLLSQKVAEYFCQVFELEMNIITKEELLKQLDISTGI